MSVGDVDRVGAEDLSVVVHKHVWAEAECHAPARKVCTWNGCGVEWVYSMYVEPGGHDVRMRVPHFGTHRARVIGRGPFSREMADEDGEWVTVDFDDGVTVLWVPESATSLAMSGSWTLGADQVEGRWEPERGEPEAVEAAVSAIVDHVYGLTTQDGAAS